MSKSVRTYSGLLSKVGKPFVCENDGPLERKVQQLYTKEPKNGRGNVRNSERRYPSYYHVAQPTKAFFWWKHKIRQCLPKSLDCLKSLYCSIDIVSFWAVRFIGARQTGGEYKDTGRGRTIEGFFQKVPKLFGG